MGNGSNNLWKREHAPAAIAIVAAAACTALLAATLGLDVADIPIRGPVPPSTVALAPAAVLVTAWGVAAQHRSTNAVISRVVLATSAVLVAWLGLALVSEYPLGPAVGPAVRLVLDAMPLALPLLFLACCLRSVFPEGGPIVLAATAATSVMTGILAAAVAAATVVAGPAGEAVGAEGVGIASYARTAWMAALFVASITILAVSPLRKLRVKVPAIASVACLALAYCATTALDGPWRQPATATLLSALLGVVIFELCLDTGLFPHVHRFLSLFRRLPFDLRIINFSGREFYRTQTAAPSDPTTLMRLAKHLPEAGGDDRAIVRSDPPAHSVRDIYRLSAGMAVLTEDTTALDQLRDRLEERTRSLANQNAVIERERAVKGEIYRQQREGELSARVERDLADTAAQIRRILDELAPAGGPDRMRQLTLVKVLIAYCKRKGMLALAAAESDRMTRDQVELIAREASADLQSIGIECAVFVSTDQLVALSAMNIVYDSFYDCVLAVLPRSKPVIMASIASHEGGRLELRMTIECAIGLDEGSAPEDIPAIATEPDTWTTLQSEIAVELDRRLAARSASHAIEIEGGLVYATARTGEGGPR